MEFYSYDEFTRHVKDEYESGYTEAAESMFGLIDQIS